jgi:tetratricopeptide (TPR) repeat protein
MSRIHALSIAVIVVLAVIASSAAFESLSYGSESASNFATPEAAFESLATQDELEPALIDQADAIITRAVRAQPNDGRWIMAQSMILIRRGDTDKAYELAKDSIRLSPEDARLQYLFGNAAFAHINDVSFINMGAVAGKGKAAYERAVELDPTLIDAHVALASYYLFAPGIAGGSVARAREIAQSVGGIEGGASEAALLRMQIEGKEKNWDGFNKAAAESVELAGDEHERQAARMQVAMILVFQGERYEDALGMIRRIHESEASTGVGYRPGTVSYIEGTCLMETGDLPGAVASFERTLEINPQAQNTRYKLAECYEELGRPAPAAEQYREFAERFKDDDRAKTAKKKAKKLEKQAAKGG